MSNKKLHGSNSRNNLLFGVNKLAQAVGSTLGPKGRTVLIQGVDGNIRATKDGVTVAREVFLEDPIENMSAQVVKEASTKTNLVVGDGTTSAMVFAADVINRSFDLVKEYNVFQFKDGMDRAVDDVCKYIESHKTELSIENTDFLKSIATISANNDEGLGELLAEAFQRVGKDGVINVVEGKTFETTFEIIDGFRIPRGFISPAQINNQRKKMIELQNPVIIIFGEKIEDHNVLFDVIESYRRKPMLENETEKPFLIICDDISEKALQMFNLNLNRGNIYGAIIKSPGLNLDKGDLLKDISKVTGASIIGVEGDILPKELTAIHCGYAQKVEITSKSTTIIEPYGMTESKEVLDDHISDVKSQMEDMEEGFLKEAVKARIARMSGVIGILYVGGNSELEIFEKKDRIEDAIFALQSALKKGIVPGGGTMFLRAQDNLELKDYMQTETDGSFIAGYKTLVESLSCITRKILENADETEDYIKDVITDVKSSTRIYYGYNALTEEFKDNLMTDGVVDSVMVLENVLKNSVSVAGTLLTTEFMIVNPLRMND